MSEWDNIQHQQKLVCVRMNVDWVPIDTGAMIAFNESSFSDTLPINGLRHPKTANLDGWYLWSGGNIPQDDNRFFKPMHVEHLIEQRPIVLKYRGLPAGWRFQIDDKGYEDIWFDESILNI